MFRMIGMLSAAALAVTAAPAAALVYVNSLQVEDVTLSIRIETDGTLGFIGIANLVSFGGYLTDQNGETFTFRTTENFRPPFNANFSYGPYLASATTFNLNGGVLATTFYINDDSTSEVLALQGASYNADYDEFLDGEYYLIWGRNGQSELRQVRIPFAEFDQRIAFVEGAGAVPEPATWAFLIVGFGVVGSAARRRTSRRLGIGFAHA